MRSSLFLLLLLVAVGAPSSARADRILPHDLVRGQGDTIHCWAYAASHYLESRTQTRSGTAVALHTERDLMYWVLHDRFLQRYLSGRPLDIGGMDDANLLSEGGFAPEFIAAFLGHGHDLWETKRSTQNPGYQYPGSYMFTYEFLDWQRPNLVPFRSQDLVRRLERVARNLSDASRMIREALDASPYRLSLPSNSDWLGENIAKESVAARMLGTDLATYRGSDLVMLEIVSGGDLNLHTRDTYMNGRFAIFHVTRAEAELVAAKSLDAGWPVLAHVIGHALAIIGKSGSHFAFVDSNEGIVWNEGFAAYAPDVGQPIAGITVLRAHAERFLGLNIDSAPEAGRGRSPERIRIHGPR